MRFLTGAILVAMTAMITTSAFAVVSDVLVPDASVKASAAPPVDPATPKNSVSDPLLPAPILSPKTQQKASPHTSSATSQTALPQTPTPYKPTLPKFNKMPTIDFEVPTPTVERTAEGGFKVLMPTSVVQIPDDSEVSKDLFAGQWPKTLHVELSNKNWEPYDLDLINTKLGLGKDQIPSLCYVKITGGLITDEMGAALDTGKGLSTDIGYSGNLRSLTATFRGMCKNVALPANQGFVIQVGDKYRVDLGAVHCNIPANANPKRIVLDRSSNKPTGVVCMFE